MDANQFDKTTQPSLRDMIGLEAPQDVRIAPDGNRVAYTVGTTNWKDNRYESVCHILDLASGASNQLTRLGSVSQMEWVDDRTLALLKKGPGEDEKPQIVLYEGLVGEGWTVTDHKTGVEWFKPFAGGFIYRGRNPERDEKKKRADQFGKYVAFEAEESASALYYIGLEEVRQYRRDLRAATEDSAKELVTPVIELSRLLEAPAAIQLVVASPSGDAIYLTTRRRDDLVFLKDTACYQVHLDARAALAEYIIREKTKKAEMKGKTNEQSGDAKEDLSYLGTIQRINLPNMASIQAVSPDGRQLLVAHRGRDSMMYTREDLWVIDREAALQAADASSCLAAMTNLTAALDRDNFSQQWVEDGIYLSYPDSCQIKLAKIGADRQISPLDFQGIYLDFNFHVSPQGTIALVGVNDRSLQEVYVARPTVHSRYDTTPLTHYGKSVEGWELGTLETIRWTSKDGTMIEGVLRKPTDFDPAKKYPLVFVVHGGPSWLSAADLLDWEDCRAYPSIQFIQKGFLVLKPNYRGSIGRGQAFAELNVNNLGVGDLWDLESAIDHLVELGWVDPERVGCMGWSQGGYISAFAGLHSDKFKAVSVGAGISDWYTYHISNDIPNFTTEFLSGSPFRNRELYQKTAPISNLANAHTPMLIQHGTEDRRVPFSNAMELYRGLKEMGVEVRLFAYPGMGHPITRPRENHAVMHQNLTWFCHYLLGEELNLDG